MTSPKKTPKKKVVEKKKAPAKKVQRRKIAGTMIVSSPVSPDVRISIASEMADDKMIEAEMMGDILPHFIYQFTNEGKTVSGLSVKGVGEVVRRLNRDPKSGYKIHIKPEFLKVERDVVYGGEKGVEVSVFAEDLLTGNSGWGIKFEPYFKIGKRGKYANTFAVEKALSKAERNAKRKLIPETVAVKMIEKMLKGGEVAVQIEAPKYIQTTVKPPMPVASTPEELAEVIKSALSVAKTIEMVIDLDTRAQKSDKLTAEQKKVVHEEAMRRADFFQ